MDLIEEIKLVTQELEETREKIDNLKELDHQLLDTYSRQIFNLKLKLQKLEKLAFLESKPNIESEDIDLYIKNIHDTFTSDLPDRITYIITLHDTKDIIGEMDIRYSLLASEKYLGNIGANIKEEYRGKRYSKKAFHLLKDTLLENGLAKPIFTVKEDNISSIKSLEAIGAERKEYVSDSINPYYVYEYDLENNNKEGISK